MRRILRQKLRLYFHYASINVRCMMQYKSSFLLSTISQFLISFNVYLGIYFMFLRFKSIKQYTYNEVLLCFSIVLLEFSLAEMFARGFDSFSDMVREGSFDRILIRPQSEILQVLGSKFELTRIGRLALFSGIFMIYASLCFFTLQGLEIINIFTDGAREYGKYPIGVYGKRVLQFTTFVIPYALIQYYPLLYLLGRSSNVLYMFCPVFAILFLIPCNLLWRIGVRHYKSSGS